MTTFDHARLETGMTGSRPKAAARLMAAAVNFLRGWRNRRAFYRLGDMSDAELSDIGLTRTDLFVSASHPFGIDPTARLGAIVRARVEAAESPARSVV